MASNRLIKRIKSYMEEFKLQHVVNGEYVELSGLDGDIRFIVHAKESWEGIKKRLDSFKQSKLRTRESVQCLICMRNNLGEGAVNCGSCSQSVCLDCFLNSMRAKRGVNVCPFCRRASGVEFDDGEELEEFIERVYQHLINS